LIFSSDFFFLTYNSLFCNVDLKASSYQFLQIGRLMELLGLCNRELLTEIHEQRTNEAIRTGRLAREGIWTESVAVGGRDFVETIATGIKRRKSLRVAMTEDGAWYASEDHDFYG
jgi:hypothetical protein